MNTTFEEVKPETLAIIEANAERFGMSVDDYLRSLLPSEEKELALQSETVEESDEEHRIKRQKSIEWIKSHRREYGGMYVALDGDELIGTGEKYGEVFKLAGQKGYKNAFIGDVLPLDYEGFMEDFD